MSFRGGGFRSRGPGGGRGGGGRFGSRGGGGGMMTISCISALILNVLSEKELSFEQEKEKRNCRNESLVDLRMR